MAQEVAVTYSAYRISADGVRIRPFEEIEVGVLGLLSIILRRSLRFEGVVIAGAIGVLDRFFLPLDVDVIIWVSAITSIVSSITPI